MSSAALNHFDDHFDERAAQMNRENTQKETRTLVTKLNALYRKVVEISRDSEMEETSMLWQKFSDECLLYEAHIYAVVNTYNCCKEEYKQVKALRARSQKIQEIHLPYPLFP